MLGVGRAAEEAIAALAEGGLRTDALPRRVHDFARRGSDSGRFLQLLKLPGQSHRLPAAEALGVACTAFLEQPSTRSAAGPGRPRKKATTGTTRPQPKRPRGRPR